MERLALLVRGVNVGGRNRLPMARFRELLTTLGGHDVRTYLNSGNAALAAPRDGLSRRVETALLDELGLDVRVLVRGATELADVVAENPFPHKVSTPKLLNVAFSDDPASAAAVAEVGRRHGEDEIAPGPGCLYLSYATSPIDSPLVPVLRRLAGTATARNWTTVLALSELAASTRLP
ncbi:MAG: DUF1697 domain-containing protein [Motilibacteraceae bacterium]